MKRTSFLWLCACLLLAGCAGRPSGGPTEIVYWTGWSGHEFDVQKRLIDAFNRSHRHIRARILSQFGVSGYQKVRIAFAGGATPDLMSTVWADELAGYARRGVLTPLDDHLKRAGRDLDRDFTPGVARMLRVEGKVYGLAATTNTSFIAYNRRIFRESGLDPDRPPSTTDELDRAARACTVYDSAGRFVRYGFRPGGLATWAYVFGGQWYDAERKLVTANDPRNVAALRWIASYAKQYDIRKMEAFQTTFGSMETPNGPFFVGKVAMWHTGEWAEQYIGRYGKGLDWGYFPLPAPPGGRKNTTVSGGSVFVIPEACRHKDAAFELLNWLTGPDAVEEFCLAIGNVPPVIEAGNRPSFQKSPLMRFAVSLAQGHNSFGPPPIPIWPTYAREIGRAEEAATLGGKAPQQLLDDLQRRMTRELARAEADLTR